MTKKTTKPSKTLKIKCDPEGNLKRMPWKKLKSMQGDFKVLDDEGRQTLRNSLEEVGFIAPFFVWYGKDFLLDGVQRTDVLDDMDKEGWKIPDKLPVVSIEAKTKKEAIANIARFSSSHGIVTTQGAINLFGIEGLKIIAPTIRIPQLDIQEILLMDSQQDETTDVSDLIDRAAELNKKWKVKMGDLWLLGEHRILCGDSTKKEDVERLMNGKKADMVFTDPPYGMNYKGKVFGKRGSVNDNEDKFEAILFNANKSFPINNGVIAICFGMSRQDKMFISMNDRKYHRQLVIYKPNRMANPWRGWIMTSESIHLFSVGQPTWNEKDHCHDVYTFDYSERPDRNIDHPTVKPLSIFVDIIKKCSHENIYDSFLGSGTTLIACEKTNRKCYGLEIDPAYVSVILQRWTDYTGKDPILEDNN